MVICAVIVIMPFVLMLTASLKSSAEINAGQFRILPAKLQFSNYPKAFANSPWGRWFANTVFVTILATLVSLVTNSMAGYAFARLEFRGKNFLFYSVLLGIMVPPQLTILPTFLIMRSIPLFGGNNLFGRGGDRINRYICRADPPHFCRSLRYLSMPSVLSELPQIPG